LARGGAPNCLARTAPEKQIASILPSAAVKPTLGRST